MGPNKSSNSQIYEKTGWTYTKVSRASAGTVAPFEPRERHREAVEECECLTPHSLGPGQGEAMAPDITALLSHPGHVWISANPSEIG